MTTQDPMKALRVPGRFVAAMAGQTLDPTAAFPCGGTALGAVVRAKLIRREVRADVLSEEYGAEPVEQIMGGERWSLAAALRGWDNDAIRAVFANTTLSTPSQFRGVDHPGTSARAGSRGSDRALPLLFVPDDRERHPGVYFAHAIPQTAEELEFELGPDREALIAVAFLALRSATGKGVQVRLLEDISL